MGGGGSRKLRYVILERPQKRSLFLYILKTNTEIDVTQKGFLDFAVLTKIKESEIYSGLFYKEVHKTVLAFIG